MMVWVSGMTADMGNHLPTFSGSPPLPYHMYDRIAIQTESIFVQNRPKHILDCPVRSAPHRHDPAIGKIQTEKDDLD